MSAGYFPKREKVGLEDLFKGLVSASHILHHHGVLDAYGHISVRSPDNPATFWMPCNISPALVSNPDDLVEYNVEDASEVENNPKPGYLERHIHSEIVLYQWSTVESNYTYGRLCLGSSVPVWDASSHYPSGSKHDFLVRNTQLGASLSAAFKPATSAGFIYSKVRLALPSQMGGSQELVKEPDHAVVLMQNHGFTTLAHGIEEAVYQAIYTKEAARAQTTALAIRNAHFGQIVEGKIDVEGGGKIKSAKVKAEGDIKYLSEREAQDAWETNQGTITRPWRLWCREIEVNALYRNECPGCDD